jgi:hypothetical protein
MYKNRKLAEADYFLGQMRQVADDYDAFIYNFSAFLAAARSVMQYARDEAIGKTGGQAWYDAQVTGSQVLAFFKDIRDMNIHVRPIEPTRSVSLHLTANLIPSGSLTMTKIDSDGNVVGEFAAPSNTLPAQAARRPAVVQYRYSLQEWSGSDDLLTLSQTYLDAVRQFVSAGVACGFVTG